MRRGTRVLAALLCTFVVVQAPTARADPPKRPVPDYDGRGPRPTTAGEVALWVPRVVLSPLYFVSEFVLRRPLGLLITTAERHHWSSTLINFFTFGEDHKAGLVPTAFYDFGFKPSVGLYFFSNDAFAPGNDLRAHASFGGTDWLAISGTDRLHVTKTSQVAIEAGWTRRPDYVFYGMGARSLDSSRSRYSADTLDVGPRFDLHPSKGVRWVAKVGARKVDLRGDRGALDDPSLFAKAATGAFVVPPGFPDGYTEGYARADLALDSRPARPEPQSGVRVIGLIEHGTNLQASPAHSWIKYGAAAGGFLDLNQHERVISLNVGAEFADPLQEGAIPFREQVVWGGTGAMRGFWFGRLVGRSGAAANLQYQWPIWMWLDGTIDVAVGNVFDAGLRDFSFRLLRLSSAIGVRSNGSPDHQFELLVGAGSETFDQGGKIDSFRLVIGGTNGF